MPPTLEEALEVVRAAATSAKARAALSALEGELAPADGGEPGPERGAGRAEGEGPSRDPETSGGPPRFPTESALARMRGEAGDSARDEEPTELPENLRKRGRGRVPAQRGV